MLIDTHAHLNFRAYRQDRTDVINRCLQTGLRVINVGSQYQTSMTAIELAQQYPGQMYAAVGFHPSHAAEIEFQEQAFNELTEKYSAQIVAIGEVGLDYYRLPDGTAQSKEELKTYQKTILHFFLGLADRRKLPVIFHCRDAYAELLAELQSEKLPAGGVVHCFLGDQAIADQFLDRGLHLGFTGIITFTDYGRLLELIRRVPIDRMLIETDAPYLAPVPYRRQRNEPVYVKHVAEKIAELKNMPYQVVVAETTKNAERLFHLKTGLTIEK